MSRRDEKLAAKYAAQGRESASATAARRAAERAEASTSRVPATSGESVMDGMRRALKQPRTEESKAAAKAYKRNLPPLG